MKKPSLTRKILAALELLVFFIIDYVLAPLLVVCAYIIGWVLFYIFIYVCAFLHYGWLFLFYTFVFWPKYIAYHFSVKVLPKLQKLFSFFGKVFWFCYWSMFWLCVLYFASLLFFFLTWQASIGLQIDEVFPDGQELCHTWYVWWNVEFFIYFKTLTGFLVVFGWLWMSSDVASRQTVLIINKKNWLPREYSRPDPFAAKISEIRHRVSLVLNFIRVRFRRFRTRRAAVINRVYAARRGKWLDSQIRNLDFSFYENENFVGHPRMLFIFPEDHAKSFYESFMEFIRAYNIKHGFTVFVDFDVEGSLYGVQKVRQSHYLFKDDPDGVEIIYRAYYRRHLASMRVEMKNSLIGEGQPLRCGALYVQGTFDDAVLFSNEFYNWRRTGWVRQRASGHFIFFRYFTADPVEYDFLTKDGAFRSEYINRHGEVIYPYSLRTPAYYEYLKRAWRFLDEDISPIFLNPKKVEYRFRALGIAFMPTQHRYCLQPLADIQRYFANYNDGMGEERLILLNYATFNIIDTTSISKVGLTVELPYSPAELKLYKDLYPDPAAHFRAKAVKTWHENALKIEAIKFYTRQIVREKLKEISYLPESDDYVYYPTVIIGYHKASIIPDLRHFVKTTMEFMQEQQGPLLFKYHIIQEWEMEDVFKDFGSSFDANRFAVPLNTAGIPEAPILRYIIPVNDSGSVTLIESDEQEQQILAEQEKLAVIGESVLSEEAQKFLDDPMQNVSVDKNAQDASSMVNEQDFSDDDDGVRDNITPKDDGSESKS